MLLKQQKLCLFLIHEFSQLEITSGRVWDSLNDRNLYYILCLCIFCSNSSFISSLSIFFTSCFACVTEHLDKPFVDFLRSRKLTDNLIHFVTEAIGMVGEGAGCREGLERTRAFLTSLGRYGTTPFLFSMYGSGELPQAFCRSVCSGLCQTRFSSLQIIIDNIWQAQVTCMYHL